MREKRQKLQGTLPVLFPPIVLEREVLNVSKSNQHSMPNFNDNIERPAESWTYPYVAAALDFSGSLKINIKKESKAKVGYSIIPKIAFFHTNKSVLGFLDEFCDQHNLQPTFRDESNHPSYTLHLGKRDDVEKMIQIIQPYMIAKIVSADILVTEIIPGLNNRKHSSKEGFIELMEYVTEFKQHLGNTESNPKYSLQYFKDEWDM
mgnify:FL=1